MLSQAFGMVKINEGTSTNREWLWHFLDEGMLNSLLLFFQLGNNFSYIIYCFSGIMYLFES